MKSEESEEKAVVSTEQEQLAPDFDLRELLGRNLEAETMEDFSGKFPQIEDFKLPSASDALEDQEQTVEA